MKQGQYLELIGPPGGGKSTFYDRISRNNSDVVSMKRAAWKMLAKTDVLPLQLRCLPTRLSAKLAKREGQKKYAKIWLEKNCTSEDRELLSTASAVLKEVDPSASEIERLIDRQPVALAMGRLAQKFTLEHQKTVIGDESVLQNVVGIFLARKTKRNIALEMRHFAELVPKPDVVINFRAPPDILWDRIQSRPRGMPRVFRGFTFDQYRAAAELIDAGIQSMRETFEQSGVRWYESTPDDELNRFDSIFLKNNAR